MAETKPSRWKDLLAPGPIISIAAFIVSLCAVIVAYYQIEIMRETQQASVWPNVEVLYGDNDDAFVLTIDNTGIGPARLEAARIEVDGETISEWAEFVEPLFGEENMTFGRSTLTGRVLPAGESIEVLRVSGEDLPLFGTMADRARISVCYCSFLERCWTAGFNDGENGEVESCDIWEGAQFQQ